MWISQPYDLVSSGRETSTRYDTHTVLPSGQKLKVHTFFHLLVLNLSYVGHPAGKGLEKNT